MKLTQFAALAAIDEPANDALLDYWKRPGKWADAKKVEARFKRFRAKIAGALKGAKVDPIVKLFVDKFPGDGKHRAAIALLHEDGERFGILWSSKGSKDYAIANPNGEVLVRGAFKDTIGAFLKGTVNTTRHAPKAVAEEKNPKKGRKGKKAQTDDLSWCRNAKERERAEKYDIAASERVPYEQRRSWTNYELLAKKTAELLGDSIPDAV